MWDSNEYYREWKRLEKEGKIGQRKKLDVITDYLYEALTFIEDSYILKDAPERLQQWFVKHKADDKKRIIQLIEHALYDSDLETFRRLFKEK